LADTYQAPKGTVDLVGESARMWDYCMSVAREVFERYSFESIYTPIFESTEVFTRGIGEATDVVGKEMYTFTDKGDRPITLRPENTAGVVRAAINAGLTVQGAGAKLYYGGPQFRYERPQKGRQRQFYQIGAEALGYGSPETDAEIIVMLWNYFIGLGIPESSMRLLLNSMGCNDCRPAYRDTIRQFILDNAGALCDECNRRADTNPLRALDCKNPSCQAVLSDAPSMMGSLCDACAVHDREVRDLLSLVQVPYQQDDSLVRGLDYYTRTVFEIQTDVGLGSQNALGGGGRYDGLFEALGGKPTPGIGFALGFERTALALKAAGVSLDAVGECDVYVACATESVRTRAFDFAAQLRDAGYYVQLDLARRSLKSQMKAADRAHAWFTAILGPDEDERGGVVLRNMETKEEQFVVYEELLDTLENQ
jgi:histidyl-tRNA synthetase